MDDRDIRHRILLKKTLLTSFLKEKCDANGGKNLLLRFLFELLNNKSNCIIMLVINIIRNNNIIRNKES